MTSKTFKPSRERRVFNNTASTGKTDKGGDYSVIKGNDAATARNKAKAEGIEAGKQQEREETGVRFPRGTGSTSSAESSARSILYDTEDFDEDSARRRLLRGAESQIEAIEAGFQEAKSQEVKLGQKDLARSNTISAMTGMAGAPEATTRAGNADRRTDERIDTHRQKKELQIASIYSEIDKNLLKEKEAHVQTQRENAARVLEEVALSAKNSLNAFASQGLSWEAIEASDPETMENLVRQSGMDPFELRILYNESIPADKKPKTLFEGFKGDNFVRILQNADGTTSTMTKTASDLGIPKDVDPATITLGNSVFWYDQNAPLGKDGSPTLHRLGAKAGYEPEDDDDSPTPSPSSTTEGQDVPTYAEFIKDMKEERGLKVLPESEAKLKSEYERLYGSGSTGITKVDLKNLTPTNKRDLSQAGLSGSDDSSKSFFLATPAAFRQFYQREVAQGRRAANLNELAAKYDAWVDKEDSDSSTGTTLSDEDFLKALSQ